MFEVIQCCALGMRWITLECKIGVEANMFSVLTESVNMFMYFAGFSACNVMV